MFYHGWDKYMDIAFPEDELRPLSCVPLKKDPNDVQMNDVLGGYALTMLDSLDMFATMNETAKFHDYVQKTIDTVSFDKNSTVQVFETTIRVIGGLLSSHLYASVPRLGQAMPGYNGELLEMAYDMGERLLPAFDTPTGIPHPRINLREGVVKYGGGEITENCASGAGSLLLEFGMLSKLTGDERFEYAARRAFFELWARRSPLDLVGMSIDSRTGHWLSPITGVGASVDSLYEYAVKYYVLFGDDQFWSMFERMERSLKQYAYDGWVFNNINFQSGTVSTSWIDSLAAFFPGLQVLAGDIESAVRMHLAYYKLWVTYAGLPERWVGIFDLRQDGHDIPTNKMDPVNLEWWPLRPEFIESNYYLYQATGDKFYLQVARGVLKDIEANCKTKCGYAGVHDVRTGLKADRMESFFFSETAKYLYLIFSPDHPLNHEFSNFVFSTEAHPFWYDADVIEHASVSRFTLLGDRVAGNRDTLIRGSLLDDDDDEQGSVFSRLWTAWENRRLKQQKQPSRRRKKRKQLLKKPPKCSPWGTRYDKTFASTSYIASWDHFYTLNSIYNYTSPSWISKVQPQRVPFELQPDFYDTLVSKHAVCHDTKLPDDIGGGYDIIEFRTLDDGGDDDDDDEGDNAAYNDNNVSNITVTKTKIKPRDLKSVKFKFHKVTEKNGFNLLKVEWVNDIQVLDRIIEMDRRLLQALNNKRLEIQENKTLVVDGDTFLNVRIL